MISMRENWFQLKSKFHLNIALFEYNAHDSSSKKFER